MEGSDWPRSTCLGGTGLVQLLSPDLLFWTPGTPVHGLVKVYQVTQESKSLVTCVHPSTTMLRVERLLIGFVSYLGLQQPCGPKEALGIHSE